MLNSQRNDPILEGRRFAWGTRTGTRTAEDFVINLGFQPSHVRVVNLTTRVEATYIVGPELDGGANVKALLVSGAGARTYADAGIRVDRPKMQMMVTVATAQLETDNCDLYWEAGQ